MNTSQKQITPKIPRKDAKNYDEKELKEAVEAAEGGGLPDGAAPEGGAPQ